MAERLIDPGGKILRHPDVLARIRRGEPVWPLHVELDLSNACNLRCRHCSFAYTHDGAILRPELAARILAELAAGGTRAVTFSGGGEPTCNPDFAEVVRSAADLGLSLGLYTNGVNVDPVLDVLDCFAWVYVSLDAVDAADYEARKGAGAFARVCEHARRLALTRRPGRTAIGVGYLLDGSNWLKADAAVALSRRIGADYCQLRPIVQDGPGAEYGWVRRALPHLEALAGPGVYVSVARLRELLDRGPRGYAVCRGSALVPCVGATGDVWVCVNTRGKRKLGCLAKDTFAAIWEARPEQVVGPDCRVACRNHALNLTLEHVCKEGQHDAFI